MSHIAVRVGADWQFVAGTKYPDEAFLRDQVFEEPRLIPGPETGANPDAAVVAVRELQLPGGGASDVVLIDSDGGICIVECKLATNPEKKRAVIGQVLDYASSLAGFSYDDLNERVRAGHDRDLQDVMRETVGDDQWDEEQFQTGVAGTLSAGTFRLVVAIDEMDPDLARILTYVSLRSGGSLRIFGLEMRYHKEDGIEVIIPHIANPLAVGETVYRQHIWDS